MTVQDLTVQEVTWYQLSHGIATRPPSTLLQLVGRLNTHSCSNEYGWDLSSRRTRSVYIRSNCVNSDGRLIHWSGGGGDSGGGFITFPRYCLQRYRWIRWIHDTIVCTTRPSARLADGGFVYLPYYVILCLRSSELATLVLLMSASDRAGQL